jgi:hypothetical protein
VKFVEQRQIGVKKMIREIKQRICEFVHERNGSKASCKNQIESCLQLIRLCDVTRIMNQVESEYETKTDWIPCEERLPKLEGEEYLVYKENGTLMLLSWTKKGWNTCKEFNGTYFTKYEIKDVIAWQPLPAPYKKEGADDE